MIQNISVKIQIIALSDLLLLMCPLLNRLIMDNFNRWLLKVWKNVYFFCLLVSYSWLFFTDFLIFRFCKNFVYSGCFLFRFKLNTIFGIAKFLPPHMNFNLHIPSPFEFEFTVAFIMIAILKSDKCVIIIWNIKNCNILISRSFPIILSISMLNSKW